MGYIIKIKMNLYKTRQLHEATSLAYAGMKEIGREIRGGRIVYFEFENLEKCQEILQDTRSGKLRVPAFNWFNLLKDLKEQVIELVNRGGL